MDKSMQQFEEWYDANKENPTVRLWDVWQASRESLEIELPKKCNASIGGDAKTKYYFNGINEGITKCHDILISNGVKIK